VNVLDLFSGIGGFSLGLERAGLRTVAFCEIEPYCRAVLRKRWPQVPCFEDVRELTADRLAAVGVVDVVSGGFPCQDISLAGDGAGLAGARSGLWSEFHRIIEALRPAYAIIENVSALRSRGLEQVLRQLAAIRYDAEWHCIPAAAVGALHRRDRVWVIAYPHRDPVWLDEQRQPSRWPHAVPHARHALAHDDGGAGLMAHADEPRLERWLREELQECSRECAARPRDSQLADADVAGQHELTQRDLRSLWREQGTRGDDADGCSSACWWRTEPDVGRVANGVPARVDRLRALGNAVVPQVVEIIGRAIMKAEQEQASALTVQR